MAFVSQLLLFLLLSCIPCHALIAIAAAEQRPSSLKPQVVCSEPKVNPSSSSGATVPLNHRHGPCSPLPTKEAPTLEELLRRDKLRAAYVQHRLGGIQQSEGVNVPTELGTPLGTLEYVITVGIGSPAVQQTMIVDTGSDVSWVRCNSKSGLALFDPSNSTTYTSFSCDSAACTQLGVEGNGCSDSQCQYMVQYVDGSNTTGIYGSDTLAPGSITVKDFQFGCSRVEEGLGYWTDGLMGLGGNAQSLVSQTEATYGEAFSYCLPASFGSSGFLTLGAQTSTSEFATTGMIRSKQSPTYYAVLLQGIRVGGSQLSVPSSVFSAGSVVDSGTVITRLLPTAYDALSTAFKEGMKQYPQAPPTSILDTCFDFSGQDNVTIPTVALMFDGGAVVDLDTNGIIIDNCLAFAATDEDGSTGIIGNVQQRTLEVLYDVGQSVFGFRSNACE